MAPYTGPSTPGHVRILLQNIDDADPDIRYMTLNDLFTILKNAGPHFMNSDQKTEQEIIEKILRKLDDQNGDVQNQAVKCVGLLAPKLTTQGQVSLLGKLTIFPMENSVDNTMRTTAMRTILSSFDPIPAWGQAPAPTIAAYGPVSKTLLPFITGTALKQGPATFDQDILDVTTDLTNIFGPLITEADQNAMQRSLLNIIINESLAPTARKKAVTALSVLAARIPDRLFGPLIVKSIEVVRDNDCPPSRRRFLITVFGSLVRTVPNRIGAFAKTIPPLILRSLSEEAYQASLEQLLESGSPDEEAQEVFEAALTATESFVSSLGDDIDSYKSEIVDAALRFLKYDPNVAAQDDEDEDMVGSQNDEMQVDDDDDLAAEEDQEFEEEGNESDDDDSSWKVRRCAVKILQAIIGKKGGADSSPPTLVYHQVAPGLIRRFSEREETVRVEVIGTLAQLVRQSTTDEISIPAGTGMIESQHPLPTRSRKRRRDSSGPDMSSTQNTRSVAPGIESPALSPSPSPGAQAELIHLSPKLIHAAQAALHQRQHPTKIAAISLLKDLVTIQPGALSGVLSQLAQPLVEALQPPSTATLLLSTNASASGSLRIEALRLLTVVCNNHSSKAIAPMVETMVSPVVAASKDRMARVAIDSIRTLEAITKVFTPPRSAGTAQAHVHSINIIFDAIMNLCKQSDADLEVRQQAIIALGTLVARTASEAKSSFLAQGKKSLALDVIAERLKNETTRLAAIQAILVLASSANNRQEIQDIWIWNVLLELTGQLRKADRTLRDNSLIAIKTISLNPNLFTRVNESTARSLAQGLIPLIDANELNTLAIALTIYSKLTNLNPQIVVTDEVVRQISLLVKKSLSGPTIDALALLLRAIGAQGSGYALTKSILDQGTRGDPLVMGRAVGTLLVYGGQSVSVSVDDFSKELDRDEARACLSLSVLGEAALLYGSSAPAMLQPKFFMKYLKSRSDQVARAAAVALGRAAIGNKNIYIPAILQLGSEKGNMKYLILHALREILMCANGNELSISAEANSIWDTLIAAALAEENQVLGSECLGRLALVDPVEYIPRLQMLLQHEQSTVRAIAIQAIRFTFSHHSYALDDVLRSRMLQMLISMLDDPDLGNRRLGLGALNSAIHHKSNFVLPQVSTLLPVVMRESKIKPDLVREVQMGPFKHKVDDGLEVRKSAYETLYTFMERDYRRLNRAHLYDRVVAGLGDEHEIKILCNLMVTKLIKLDPEETVVRLDQIAEQYRAILSVKLKDNSVKQEFEKDDDMKRSAQRMSIILKNTFPQTVNPAETSVEGQHWRSYWQWLIRDFKTQLQILETELYQQGTL